jgi:hypothetical protein
MRVLNALPSFHIQGFLYAFIHGNSSHPINLKIPSSGAEEMVQWLGTCSVLRGPRGQFSAPMAGCCQLLLVTAAPGDPLTSSGVCIHMHIYTCVYMHIHMHTYNLN